MNIILLSGGSGKRLWPLSNAVRSKQFLKLFKNDAGAYESMVQRVYRQIISSSPDATVVVAAGSDQVSAIRNQLGDKVSVCLEPMRRDTFPAIALAATYMYSERGLDEDDIVIVCPVDPYVVADYFEALKRLEVAVSQGDANLTLMGVHPTNPSEKFGYIVPAGGTAPVRRVLAFKEKPDEATARLYIDQGALWNCGVFAFRLGYLLEIVCGYIPTTQYQAVYNGYEQLPKTSFDYAVVEKENNINCIEFAGQWKDVGIWNTLAEEMDTPTIGNVYMDDTCCDVQVINELETPLLVMGASHMVIAASVDGILVSSKEQSPNIKTYVDKIQQRVMFEEKSWGTFTVLSSDANYLTAKLCVMVGMTMSCHQHDNRDEVWTVLSGEGMISLNGAEQTVRAGDVIQLPKGAVLTLQANTAMQLIEIQISDQSKV